MGGFTKIEWNQEGAMEKALLEAINKHGEYPAL
jgi:hypothetical protein